MRWRRARHGGSRSEPSQPRPAASLCASRCSPQVRRAMPWTYTCKSWNVTGARVDRSHRGRDRNRHDRDRATAGARAAATHDVGTRSRGERARGRGTCIPQRAGVSVPVPRTECESLVGVHTAGKDVSRRRHRPKPTSRCGVGGRGATLSKTHATPWGAFFVSGPTDRPHRIGPRPGRHSRWRARRRWVQLSSEELQSGAPWRFGSAMASGARIATARAPFGLEVPGSVGVSRGRRSARPSRLRTSTSRWIWAAHWPA